MTKGNIIFLHPDLGVGGAERLVIDAALSLKTKGYEVQFITSHHDSNHCFEETKDGTLPVTVVGDFLPRHIFGKFYALCAYLRMVICSLYIIWFHKPDIVFCDLVSICIPILHLGVSKVIFYCHFPDQLLSKKGSFIKQAYRTPLNWLEGRTTGLADKLFVNSIFTKSVFTKTFPSISAVPDVLYPSINTKPFDKVINSTGNKGSSVRYEFDFPKNAFIFLSINRYERKKNVELSLKSLYKLKDILSSNDWNRVRLIIAGGYDTRVNENVEYYNDLKKLSVDLQVQDKLLFLKSPSDELKINLLAQCDCLLYTPSNEHFGIVPLEAMYCSKPVIAVNSGGPTETVVNGETGFLCQSSDYDFSQSMGSIMLNTGSRNLMGEKGRSRFIEKFSYETFSDKLNKVVTDMLKS